jgi:NhaA family Na+:H+ antiporter
VFVAALSVVDDILSMLILAVFYPRDLHPIWLGAVIAVTGLKFALNRWRVYSAWPYLLATVSFWRPAHHRVWCAWSPGRAWRSPQVLA